MALEETTNVNVKPADKSKVRKLWMVALILGVVTALEFVVAFNLPHTMKWTKIAIFVGMTFIKAFYIVAEFMHLKYEVKTLLWSILIPMVFVVWLLIALILEGDAIYDVVY